MFINGDKIIGTHTYHKIYTTGQHTNWCPSYSGYYYNACNCALRQDSLQKKVFQYSSTYSKDTLLYDFNLNVGDTLPHTLNNNS